MWFRNFSALLLLLALSALLAGCGGSGSAPASATGATRLVVSELLFAQTHVLPASGLSWTLTDTTGNTTTTTYELIGNRDALAIVSLGQADAINPALEVWFNGVPVASIALNAPASMPPTEANGPAFRRGSYSAVIPAQWMQPGIDFKATAANYLSSAMLGPVNVGSDGDLIVKILPFYLYGASPGAGGAPTLAQTRMPDAASRQEMFAKWPVSSLRTLTHPAGLIQWPYMVIGPRNGGAAYRALSKNDQKDGFATMSSVLDVLAAMRKANGEEPGNNMYYAPLLMWDNTNTYQGPGGGLGGGHRGTGDFTYTGIFIHEMGHAFGLPHQGTAYLQGKYPYIDGSLKGSVWGYDQTRNEFLAPFVPSSAPRFANCLTNPAGRPTDAQGRCVKRDPMWGGAGDEAAGYKYATFSDFSTAQMQQDIKARIYLDANSATGFSQWDAATRARVDTAITTTNNGIFGLDKQLPVTTGVPVHSIIITYSNAPCLPANPGSVCNAAGVDTSISQIYPPVSYVGNLRRVIDPTNPADLASIVPNTSVNPWFCRSGGCDYSVRVTFADTTTWHGLIQGGFRPWNQDSGAPAASASDPLNAASFKTWGVNVPGGKAIAKVELLYTPMVWNGFPANPTVLLVR